MTPEDFERLRALTGVRAGLRLTRDRMHLAEHRLGPIARREGFASVDALLSALWEKPSSPLAWSAIEALLNAETWFRRDRQPFDTLAREMLPALGQARGRAVRIWAAGCSTGQEAYSLALAAADAGVSAEITAVDLSQRAIEKARSGLYTAFEIQRGLSAATMLRGFLPEDDQWRARAELRASIAFDRANLLDESTDTARYDVIFCRYVLSDMEPARRAQVLDSIESRLMDDGCLFLGLGERPDGETVAFRPVVGREGLYVKAPTRFSRAA
jgi:chemotaxis protein methyltransferase CheR